MEENNIHRQYWACRIHNDQWHFLYKELEQGRFRQGWGYHEGQNLKQLTFDGGARRNLKMLEVKKGDIVIVPHIKGYNMLTFVRATENWNEAYRFERDKTFNDYGHIFPAEIIFTISKWDERVSFLFKTLKCKGRIWSINKFQQQIDELLKLTPQQIGQFKPKRKLEQFSEDIFYELFKEDDFKNKIYEHACKNFHNEQWEFLLVDALSKMFPQYEVERTGGQKEKFHGTDITITIPNLLGMDYIIAVQVKDYEGGFDQQKVIEQINKAEQYFNSQHNTKVIGKFVFVIRAGKEENKIVQDEKTGVRFIFAEDIKELLLDSAMKFVGLEP